MTEIDELLEEKENIEELMLETAEDYLFQDISIKLAMQESLELIISYNYVVRKLEELKNG
jgi:hypothetical protein